MFHCKYILENHQRKVNFFSPFLFFSIANFIILFISLCICIEAKTDYPSVVWLPVCYTFLYSITRSRMCWTQPGILMLNIVSFMRYSVSPLVVLLSNEVNYISNTKEYLPIAVAIMVYEMAAIFITLLVYNPHSSMVEEDYIKNRSLILLVAVFIAIVMLLFNRSFIGNLSLMTGVSVKTTISTNTTSGAVSILWQSTCVLIFCLVMRWIYETQRENRGIFLSLFSCLVYLLVIYTGQVNISRWYAIVTLFAAFCWFVKLYPKRLMTIILIVVIPAGVVLIIATVLKNTKVGLGAGFINTIVSLFNSTNMDTYFAGPVNVNTAIAIKETGRLSANSIIYDVLNNFPLLNHFIDRSNASVNIFNAYLGRGDQIIPLVGQSFSWFGYLFSPLLSVFSAVLVRRMDALFAYSNSIKTYLYAFLSVWCALMPILNVTIWLSWMYSRIIPAFLLFEIVAKQRMKSNTQCIS